MVPHVVPVDLDKVFRTTLEILSPEQPLECVDAQYVLAAGVEGRLPEESVTLKLVAEPAQIGESDATAVPVAFTRFTVTETVAVVIQLPSVAVTVYIKVPAALGVIFTLAPFIEVAIPLPEVGEAVHE